MFRIWKKKIKQYLTKGNLIIRPLFLYDLEYLSHIDNQESLCGDMDISISPILDEINEIKDEIKDISEYPQDDRSIRITYVLCHKSNPKIILGFVTYIVNYNEKALLIHHILWKGYIEDSNKWIHYL